MLPETIDDLLDVAKTGQSETAELSSAIEMLQFAAPILVFLAAPTERLYSPMTSDRALRRNSLPTWPKTWQRDWTNRNPVSSQWSRLSVDAFDWRLRLPKTASGGMLACLVESPSLFGKTLNDASATAAVCSAFAGAALRYKARQSELSARVEQLMAGQDALRASYAQSLAEAIEEHELRLREQEAAHGQLVQAQKLESIGQLAAGIAHEINTPIQFIGDNLRFLEDAFRDLMPLLAGVACSHAGDGESRPGVPGAQWIRCCKGRRQAAMTTWTT